MSNHTLSAAINVAKAGEEVATARRQAMSIAVLAQLYVANANYQEALRQFKTNQQLSDIDGQIVSQLRNRYQAAGLGELDLIQGILGNIVPQCEVWAFGSRVGGPCKPYSDLDIAIVSAQPLPLQLLAEQPHVRYDRNSFGGRLVTRFLREQQIDVHVALELDELEAIVKMVECGLGVSLIPQAGLWLERSPKVRIIPLGGLTFYREIILLSRHSQQHLPVPQLFTRCLLADASL